MSTTQQTCFKIRRKTETHEFTINVCLTKQEAEALVLFYKQNLAESNLKEEGFQYHIEEVPINQYYRDRF